MVREMVMAAICVGAVIALAWLMDHPQKVFGSLLVLGVFVVIVAVAYVKKQNEGPRYQRKRLEDRKKSRRE
ncbi:MAG: hypothetical protein QGG64_02655 [Candidatus Latescibacteria bacterium]|jgi:hypothetical protein|nr:hypothetical protein [Candidatus Latescibacterota bacterium]